MPNDSAKMRQKLSEIYEKETAINQQIIQLLSIIYEPITRTAFLECFQGTGHKDEQGKAYNNKTLKVLIDHLLKRRLLVESEEKKLICNPLIVEIATRDSIKQNTFEQLVSIIAEKIPIKRRSWGNQNRQFDSEQQLIREIRIGIYGQDLEFIEEQIKDYKDQHYKNDFSLETVMELVFTNPFDEEWFCRLPQLLYEQSLISIITKEFVSLNPVDDFFELLEKTCAGEIKESSDSLQLLLIEQLIIRNRLEAAEQQLNSISLSPERYYLLSLYFGLIYFIQGNYQESINAYKNALKGFKQLTRKRKIYFDHFAGLFFILALIKDQTSESLKLAEEAITIVVQQGKILSSNKTAYQYLEQVISLVSGDVSVQNDWDTNYLPTNYSIASLLTYFCCYWLNPEVAKNRLPKLLNNFFNQTYHAGYYWLAWEAGQLLLRLEPETTSKRYINQLIPPKNSIPLVELIQLEEPWQLSLNALINFNRNQTPPVNSPQPSKRLAWFLSLYQKSWSLKPKEQIVTKQGGWSQGRPIALKRLARTTGEFDYLTPQDLKTCAKINVRDSGYYGDVEYIFDEEAIIELIGHPFIFWENSPQTKVEIVKATPELLVKKSSKKELTLKLSPPLYQVDSPLVWQETLNLVKVLIITPDYQQIAKILGKKNQLRIPISAQEQVLAAINTISSLLTVHSDIGGDIVDAIEVEAQPIPHLQLLPNLEGLSVRIMVCPFGQGKSFYQPGSGGETVIAEIDGKRYQTTRNLKQEKKLVESLINNCPSLNAQNNLTNLWEFDDPEDCLELLLQLQECKEQVVIEWPEGETFKVTNAASFAQLKLNINGKEDWFEVTGELKLDESLVLELQQLLDLLEKSPGRFLPLGDGQFLALTDTFRQRLDEFRLFSEKQKKGRKLHHLSTLALQDFFSEIQDLKADQKWLEHCQRIQKMTEFIPRLPGTFQGELRDYQLEGFNWLARLSFWGVGACLADDMGLGKTIQALAVILTRANLGSTLIIAPTSVCFNWINEAVKFAPTLNLILFGSGNRQEILDNLQPFDVLICSYGLLQQETVSEMLAKVTWENIVLDEAQFIKNITTKRSQAAMTLQGNFKLITTGTPIENHLGELWTLFRFINPGLLGSLQHFNQRFVSPIDKSDHKLIHQQLKRLIQPFILRRTKTQVLSELPPRTETILYVELSPEEMALYEVLRREALEQLTDSEDKGGQKHLQVLAALMRLRRCCCNPSLILPDTALNSSKLELFKEVIDELRDNRHKALVFSQFVDHLTIVKNYLEQENISYQYLDGSTPMKERQQRVQAFQSGEGDVFLISLKAGGTGLNLTAADYVIHLDPWWNPAVEDQATDRAYRIGQTRPVTVYRLVVKDTIEEKIVQLHHQKRDLADSLLSGTDVSGKMSTSELLDLMK
ncbi:DEAD/DEAH box helicase [Crocosphaera sp. XPORK-15E]|uniref:DEAD/DEAH box helicase n=1 Tax=Crocosphaera sp. XPORK-15E TaxID=3110247 RepID=UPI002B206A80|nr:SNF2-related protein [Crocosphaera sp. XPORK-15E]MEA5537344.1 SNF2-related protein [Crocosphaera sp. XPORK-15E]